jgi:hemoglobin
LIISRVFTKILSAHLNTDLAQNIRTAFDCLGLTSTTGLSGYKSPLNQTTRNKNKEAVMTSPNQPSLYERLGGIYSIATVVDDFINRIMVDPRLNANPRVDEAHHRVPPAGFKYLVTEMVCWATGGPQTYTGRSMHDSHQHLQITAAEWGAFIDDLQQTMDKFGVPHAEQKELKAIVDSTRADIVV